MISSGDRARLEALEGQGQLAESALEARVDDRGVATDDLHDRMVDLKRRGLVRSSLWWCLTPDGEAALERGFTPAERRAA